MASTADLPCDGDGICMICKSKPPEEEAILCSTCATPWHVPCLSKKPESLASVASWECPDCSAPAVSGDGAAEVNAAREGGDLITAIRAIQADSSLTEQEKAKKRQELLSGGAMAVVGDDAVEDGKEKGKKGKEDVMDLLDENIKCSFCMQLPERPVSTPCGHNFCLKCFQKWTGQGKRTCVKCRADIPSKMASQPRINSALVLAIRLAKSKKPDKLRDQAPLDHYIRNEDRPEQAYTTERAKKSGKANACSGQIFVTIPPDFFGPIPKEYDPKFGKGVYVGQVWADRLECRQWGAHFPHVAGIAGQSEYGAQSVALSGGYADDEDHGEWFLYTGSGGRDLSGNKRTNKDQAFDQKFEKLNAALRVSCKKGYPVRVVRSHKEKRSSYAPEEGVRYDGVYRIEKCWCKVGIQGFKVCRYLFVRCDNDPAPWTSDEHGDRPRPLPIIEELKHATDISERKGMAAWDYVEGVGWKWTKNPPLSRKTTPSKKMRTLRRHAKNMTVRKRLLKEFSCFICHNVMKLPLTTPCAHNFCKPCLMGAFDDLTFVRERTRGGRTLRAQKIVKKCPCCPNDISEFLQNPQVNRELMDLIESLQREIEQENGEGSGDDVSDVTEKSSDTVDKMSIETGEGMETKSIDNGSDGVEKLNGVKFDNFEEKRLTTLIDDCKTELINQKKIAGQKIEAVDGDSEVNVGNSEELEKDCQTPNVKKDALSPRKRKKPSDGVRPSMMNKSKKLKEATSTLGNGVRPSMMNKSKKLKEATSTLGNEDFSELL